MELSSKRAEHISLVAFILNILFCIATYVIGALNESLPVISLSWQILGGAFIWFVLIVQFHQRSRAEQEKLDIDQLKRSRDSGTIFQGDDSREAMFAVAAKRLEVLEKWFIPVFGVLIAFYLIGIGLFHIYKLGAKLPERNLNPAVSGVLLVIIGFIQLLVSRYATGMSTQAKWKPLRAGGSTGVCTTILAWSIAASFGFAVFKIDQGLIALKWVIPILMIVLGVEIILNTILDIYRPRVAGQYARSAFDSRLLGLINEPGGIFHTVSSAIDYQFGFKVSQTWFYRLLEKAILPLVLFATIVIYLMSCFVVVNPGEEAIIEHFGSSDPAKGGRYVKSGLHLKLPNPFDKAYKYPTGKIEQIDVGFVKKEDDENNQNKNVLWGKEHFGEEFNILVATGDTEVKSDLSDAAVSIIRAAIPVQYRVKNLRDYLYNYSDPDRILEAICYRELLKLAASAKIETDGDEREGAERYSILGAGRGEAAKSMARAINEKADEMGLGIEVVLVNLQGIHPPPDVAKDYHDVISAVQKGQTAILEAQAERNKKLASLCGSVEQVDELIEIAKKYSQLRAEGSDESQVRKVREEFDSLSNGEVFDTLRKAESYKFERVALAKATGERFASQEQAFRKGGKVYLNLLRLNMLEDAVAGSRKYIVIADKDDTQVFIVNLEESLTSDIIDMELLEEAER